MIRGSFLRSSRRHLCGDVAARFAFIEQNASTWPVNVMCRVLGVLRSGHYDWYDRSPSTRTTANLALLDDLASAPGGSSGAIRQFKDARCPAGGRSSMQPWPHRATDASISQPCAGAAPLPAMYDRQPLLSADRAQSAGAALFGAGAQPDLARRHHLISQPAKAGCISPSCSIWCPVRPSAGWRSPRFQPCEASLEWRRRGCASICAPNCRSRWWRNGSDQRPASFVARIVDRNMPRGLCRLSAAIDAKPSMSRAGRTAHDRPTLRVR